MSKGRTDARQFTGGRRIMRDSIRPDVHARFVALLARADAKVRSDQEALQKRSSRLLARETRERARAAAAPGDDAA
jgi:hypothetical protein